MLHTRKAEVIGPEVDGFWAKNVVLWLHTGQHAVLDGVCRLYAPGAAEHSR